jgi:hypothetical protein
VIWSTVVKEPEIFTLAAPCTAAMHARHIRWNVNGSRMPVTVMHASDLNPATRGGEEPQLVGRRCSARRRWRDDARGGGWAWPVASVACDARALFSLSPVPLLAPPVSVSVSGTRGTAGPAAANHRGSKKAACGARRRRSCLQRHQTASSCQDRRL